MREHRFLEYITRITKFEESLFRFPRCRSLKNSFWVSWEVFQFWNLHRFSVFCAILRIWYNYSYKDSIIPVMNSVAISSASDEKLNTPSEGVLRLFGPDETEFTIVGQRIMRKFNLLSTPRKLTNITTDVESQVNLMSEEEISLFKRRLYGIAKWRWEEALAKYVETVSVAHNPNAFSVEDPVPLIHFVTTWYIEMLNHVVDNNRSLNFWNEADFLKECWQLIDLFSRFPGANLNNLNEDEEHIFDLFDFSDKRYHDSEILGVLKKFLMAAMNGRADWKYSKYWKIWYTGKGWISIMKRPVPISVIWNREPSLLITSNSFQGSQQVTKLAEQVSDVVASNVHNLPHAAEQVNVYREVDTFR